MEELKLDAGSEETTSHKMGMHTEQLAGRTQQVYFDAEETENFTYPFQHDVDFNKRAEFDAADPVACIQKLVGMVEDPEQIRDGLMRQVESSVLWAPTLKQLVADGMQGALEPGPGKVVAGLVKQVDRGIPVQSVLDAETLEAFVNA